MSDQLEWFERQLATLEAEHNQLVRDFHLHAEQAVHAGFVDYLKELRADVKVLQARWIQVGGAVIGLLITILLSLLAVLWTLVHPAPVPLLIPAPVPTMVTHSALLCADFPSQAAAQAFYRSDPIMGTKLDRTHNGVACKRNRAPYDRVPVIGA